MSQLAWLIGLVTCVCLAILGQAELVGEPWRHYLSVGAIVGTAMTGYMLQHPAPPWDRQTERRSDPPIEGVTAMKFDWKPIARIGAQIAGGFVPGAVQIEQMAEAAVVAPTNHEKAAISVEAALASLRAEGIVAGKNYATPRVEAAARRLNDASVEFVNALAEAHAAPSAALAPA
jgi:hypothetical protein